MVAPSMLYLRPLLCSWGIDQTALHAVGRFVWCVANAVVYSGSVAGTGPMERVGVASMVLRTMENKPGSQTLVVHLIVLPERK